MPPYTNRLRTVILTVIVVGAVVAVVLWNRHEDATVVATASGSAQANPAGSGSSAPAAGSSSATEKLRKIDRKGRDALMDRIRTARAARTSGGAGTTTPSPTGISAGDPPPALPGTISKDDIRAGVRAVIPLLTECYAAAEGRFKIKAGEIKVQMHLTGEPAVGTLIETADVGGDPQFTSDAEFVECLQQTMLSVELPPIAEGGTIDVTYPLAFSSDE